MANNNDNSADVVDTDFAELMSAKEVAAKIRRSAASLARDRCNGVGIPYLKYGHNVFYKKEDVLYWQAKHQILNEVQRNVGMKP